MQTTPTTQTAFRFSQEMLRRMKNKARLMGKSVNAYVEDLIEKDLGDGEDRYEELYRELSEINLPKTTSPDVASFMERYKIEFTQEELDENERLAYLIGK